MSRQDVETIERLRPRAPAMTTESKIPTCCAMAEPRSRARPFSRRPPSHPALTALALLVLLSAVAAACGGSGQRASRPPASGSPATGMPDETPAPGQLAFDLPSIKGLNYGGPAGANGQWLGSRWLRPGTATDDGWALARPRLRTDLDFIVTHHLGRVQRIFIGLDQLMVWDRSTGFVRFDEAAVANLSEALDMFDAHHLKVIAVVFDQEEVASPGNFHFEALDGQHPDMRANYLKAVDQFFQRFGSRPTVIGWDLFNEAYNSLGREGGLSRPPAEDPVSPNYPDETVHSWIRDLYQTAKRAAPLAWFTVSDTTELYWKDPPDTAKYEDAVDFYDIHVYDDHPSPKNWERYLHKPYLLGEVGGDVERGLKNQSVNSRVVGFWLSHARPLGIKAVLAHDGDQAVYSLRSGLTATGRVVEAAR